MADAKIVLSAVDNASRVLAGVRSSLSQTADAAGRLGGVFGAIGAAAALGGMTAFIRSTVDGIDALNDLKDATGDSIENLSALEDIAGRNGTSFDTLTGLMVRFNAVLKDAKPGSEAEAALRALGLEVDKLRKMAPSEALQETARALSRWADDGERARYVQELFGKSVREVAPFLKDLADAGGLVAKVTTQQAEEAEKFNKQLAALAKNAEDAKRYLVNDLVFGINEASRAMRESGLLEGLRTLLTGTAQYKNDKRLAQLTDELLRAQNALDEARGARIQSPGRIATLEGEVKRLNKELEITLASRRQLEGALALPEPAGTKPPSLPPLPGAGGNKDPNADFKAYLGSLEQQLQKTQELTAAEKLLDDIRRGALTVTPQQKERLATLAREIDLNRQLKDEEAARIRFGREAAIAAGESVNRAAEENATRLQKEEAERIKAGRDAAIAAGDAVNRAAEDNAARLKRLLEGGPLAQLEAQRREMLLLAEQLEKGFITPQQFEDAATGFLGLNQKIEESKSLAQELGLSFASAFEDAVIGGKEFSEVLKGLAQDGARLFFRRNVTEPFLSAIDNKSTSGGGLTGWIRGLFGGSSSPAAPGLMEELASYGVFHRGGIAGVPSGDTRMLEAAVFGGARRYHRGGLVGDEVPAVLQKGEGVFTAAQMKALGAGLQQGGGAIHIVNNLSVPIGKVTEQRTPDGDRVLILEEAEARIAAALTDPNSRVSRSLGRSFDVRRRR